MAAHGAVLAATAKRRRVLKAPPGGHEVASYDLLGRVAGVHNGNGQLTTHTWDVLDRLVSTISASGITVSHTYDAVGKRVATTDPHGTTAWTYDALGRVVSESLPSGVGLTYTWDAAGNLSSFTGYTGTVTYTYDALNRVVSLTDPGPVTTTFAYADLVDGAHDRKTTTYPGGTVQTELVDQAGRLASIGAVRSGTTLTGLSYTYEESSNDQRQPADRGDHRRVHDDVQL
jgi:YD repeat-containing protein